MIRKQAVSFLHIIPVCILAACLIQFVSIEKTFSLPTRQEATFLVMGQIAFATGMYFLLLFSNRLNLKAEIPSSLSKTGFYLLPRFIFFARVWMLSGLEAGYILILCRPHEIIEYQADLWFLALMMTIAIAHTLIEFKFLSRDTTATLQTEPSRTDG